MKKLYALLAIATLFCLTFTQTAHASNAESITSYNSQVIIGRTNTATITETIAYDFSDNPHHGIYRDIPIDYHDGKDSYYVSFSFGGVWDESGNPLQTTLTQESGNERIKIGDPNTTLTGTHTYQIAYTLSLIITKKNDKPLLNLDLVGEGWQVPIKNISAKVSLEDDTPLQDISWYGGGNGVNTTSQFNGASLGAYSGLTINATLPDGYVTTYLQPNKQRPADAFKTIAIIYAASLIGVIILVIAAIFAARGIKTHRLRKRQIVVAQYDPPSGLLPAHIGLLQDDYTDNREITATIIDWAVRGYIKITFLPKQGLLGKNDYELTELKPSNDMAPFEQSLYFSFLGGGPSIKLQDVNTVTVQTQVAIFKSAIKEQLTDLGYYEKTGSLLTRGTLTANGAAAWAYVDGFRLYLNTVEKDRLAFSDAPAKTPERFSACLPYAIALGVEKEWAKQFEGIDITPATNWYNGNLIAFSALTLASDLGSSFAPIVSSNSSVSSAGGSSGGGFGGGGGGSW